MPQDKKKFEVRVKHSTLEVYHVDALCAEDAESLVMEGEGELHSTDDEVYAPEVVKVRVI